MTVMVPDLVLICENMLMAEGFIEAKVCLRGVASKQRHGVVREVYLAVARFQSPCPRDPMGVKPQLAVLYTTGSGCFGVGRC